MTRLDLALEIIRAAANDKGQESCGYVEGESVCVIRKGHKGNHLLETARQIVPIE